jgi:histidinol dehydrogenase
VTAAKMLLQNSEAMIAIDMPAGPSEVKWKRVAAEMSVPPSALPQNYSMKANEQPHAHK